MKKILKYGCLTILIGFSLMMFIGYSLSNSDKDSDLKEEKIILSKEWSKQSKENKEKILNFFINSKGEVNSENNFRMRLLVLDALPKLIKYPETLEFKEIGEDKKWVSYNEPIASITYHDFFKIIDIEKGILNLNIPFRSESSIGLKIRKNMFIKFKYDGTRNFKILKTEIQ
ncbi:hypothetical protein [Tenacibaculum dicentrarchi]|uniref:hypothetical protein n=1 Tax=Tenacibaculum dicentrarchi TaxID=669041 RepID=UPI001BE650F9